MKSLVVVCGPAGCGKSTIGEYLAKEKGCLFLEGDDYHPQANRDKMHAGIPLTDDDRAGWLETLAAVCITALATNTMVIVSCSALKLKYRQVFRTAVVNANLANLFLATKTPTIKRKLSLKTSRRLSLTIPTRSNSTLTTPRKLSLTAKSKIDSLTCSLAATAISPVKGSGESIKLSFIFLSMSQPKASRLVRARALSTGHFMPATLVNSQFDILELPGEGESDARVFDADLGVGEVKRGCLGMLQNLLKE